MLDYLDSGLTATECQYRHDRQWQVEQRRDSVRFVPSNARDLDKWLEHGNKIMAQQARTASRRHKSFESPAERKRAKHLRVLKRGKRGGNQ